MKPRIIIDKNAVLGKVEPEVFGSFVEHLGRCVYNGIYEPDHPLADERGFRKDVIAAIADLHVPVLRYPGGNFVSGYDWKDTIGPNRRTVLDLAWKALESNEVGIDEFAYFAEQVGSEVMMAVNLATDTIKSAHEIVEYCNLEDKGYWANLRKEHGREKPYKFRYWCLGNEMDGPWQIGTKTAEEYGIIATEAAKVMKWVDPSIKVIACGSSASANPTFPMWDREVLEKCFDVVDYLSLHHYFTYLTPEHDLGDFYGSAMTFDHYISTLQSTLEYVKAVKRSKKQIYFAVDEWNVWHAFDGSNKVVKDWELGLPLLENHYDFADAVVVATLLSTLINHADIVKMACFAQLVNVIAPILTEKGGCLVKQTIYYPISMISKAFAGTDALRTFSSIKKYETKSHGAAPEIYNSVSYNKETGEYIVLLVNTSQENKDIELIFDQDVELISSDVYQCDDPHQKNTLENPFAIIPSKETIEDKSKNRTHSVELGLNAIKVLIFK